MELKIQQKILVLPLLLAFMPNHAAKADAIIKASVSFSEAESAPSEPAKKIIKQKSNWHQLHGSLDRQSVYLIVKKTGQRQIEGYLFDGHGSKKYIYGEWFHRELQIYDQSKKRLTVILYD